MPEMELVMMGVVVRELMNWGWAPREAALNWGRREGTEGVGRTEL